MNNQIMNMSDDRVTQMAQIFLRTQSIDLGASNLTALAMLAGQTCPTKLSETSQQN